MNNYNKEDLAQFTEVVQTKLDKANKELSFMKDSQRSVSTHKDSLGNDLGDLSNRNQQVELQQSLMSKLERKINELEAAKHRIENGTYGVCESSGELISKERLLAQPTARRNIDEKKNLTDRLNNARS